MSPWTDSLVERLIALHREGRLSFGQIAKKFGLTRNAVIGKANRMGLSERSEANHSFYGAPRTRKCRKAPSVKPLTLAARSAPPTPELHVNFFDLEKHHCRYPLTDGTYCGRQVQRDRTAFCPHHELICYRPE
jgi:GcrA cell cycle regulator